MKRIFIFTNLVLLAIVSSCGTHDEKKEHEHTKYLVTKPIVKDTIALRNYVCQIRAHQHIELRALERGYLQKIFVDEGQFIKEGQVMFQIMPMIYQAEMQKAQAEANYAEIEYKNTKQLADQNVVSQNELALIKARLRKQKLN